MTGPECVMADMSGSVTTHGRAEYEWRAWQPGDGLRCSGASRGADCGPPVVVRTLVDRRSTRTKYVRRVMCELHVAGHFMASGLGGANAEIEKQARDTVIHAHWDEYQQEIRQRQDKALHELLAQVPAEIRPLVERGIAAHSDEGGAE